MSRPKRCAAIHDISGFGRCSLSVILPVMSAMGIQVCPVPTAVLSTHTGGFGEAAKRDLTDYIAPALSHYLNIGVEMECIYTGYLGCVSQVSCCKDFFDAYPNALKVADPVMGDHGKLYNGFGPELVSGVSRLAFSADVITPNLTEAAILLGDSSISAPLSASAARSLLSRLCAKGPKLAFVTGVALASGEYGNICLDLHSNSFWKSTTAYLPVRYPGTGDIFAAVLTASLMRGDSPPMAMDRATRYVELTIKTTYGYSSDTREGVMLERTLEWLTRDEVPMSYSAL